MHRRIAADPRHRTISAGYAFVAHQQRLIEQGHYLYGWSHLPAHKLNLPPRTSTLTILRDPMHRVVSLFRYQLTGDPPGTPFAVPDEQRALAASGFESFLDELPQKQLLRQLFMFSSTFNVSEAVDRISECSMVLALERFDAGVVALSRTLNLPLSSRHERASSGRCELSDESRDRLRELLEPEYELIQQLGDLVGRVGNGT
ncbi:MAG: hypothetical protein ACRD6W_01495 [Nitrososphaerales archaeon]